MGATNVKSWVKCLSVALAMSSLIVVTAPATAESPKDVKPDHPAYRAVQTLIDQGFISVFQDGSFQGERPVDRYTLAVVVARLLADIQSGKLVLPNEEMKTLRQLATEFRAELVEVAGQTAALSQAQEKTAGEVAVVREDTTKLLAGLYQQEQAVANLQRDVQSLQEETARQTGILKGLEGRAADAEALASVHKTVNEVLVPQTQALVTRQKTLESGLDELRAEFESYRRVSEGELATLKAQSRNQLMGGLLVAALLFLTR